MTREAVTVRAADSGSAAADADVTRYGSLERSLKAGLYIAGGLIGGAACIIVPVLHLVTTWALPLLGILAGVRAARVEAIIRDIRGRCPACDEPIELAGGSMGKEPMLAACPRCRAALEVGLGT
ncbi:MAG: hypothetical protein ACYTGG_14505 [Planctomycetota bacterium]|jgi:hypothetical protein